MPGATLQLIAQGSQDVYLTGNPQITFFKVVYRRHTNFSMENLKIGTIEKSTPFSSVKPIEISKNGDLIHKISLHFNGQKVYNGHGLANPSTALINNVTLSIGGHEIDKLHGHWIEVWNELTQPNHNGTVSNITKIDDNSISHLASNLDAGLCDFFRKNQQYFESVSASDTTGSQTVTAVKFNGTNPTRAYMNNRMNKLTNIFGTGISYPPTPFQKKSRSGGVYCEPTYLAELRLGVNADGADPPAGTKYTNASQCDYSMTVGTTLAVNKGSNGSGSTNTMQGLITLENINKSIRTGSVLGVCILDLPFYFSKDPGLSIPLIALQNQDVYINITLASKEDGLWSASYVDTNAPVGGGEYISNNGTISNPNNVFNAFKIGPNHLNSLVDNSDNLNMSIDIYGLFIYLDTNERRRFAEVSHEYLIEQVQYVSKTTDNQSINISDFTHPVKEIIWTGKPYKKADIIFAENGSLTPSNKKLNAGSSAHVSGVRFQPGTEDNISGGSILNSSYTLGFGNATDSASGTLATSAYTPDSTKQFANHGRFITGLLGPSTPSCLDDCNWSVIFNGIQRTAPMPLQEYTRNNVERYHTGYGSVSCPDSIAVYSFALKPEEHQPSGTCNFSRIDSAFLKRETNNSTRLNIYAVNYNILRFMGGMASLAYNL